MDEWIDLPEALREPLRAIAARPHDYGYNPGMARDVLFTVKAVIDYMVSEHTCQFGHRGSKVNACEELALIDSVYCAYHGGN